VWRVKSSTGKNNFQIFFVPYLTEWEGEVYGKGCKIFTIAGPVILFGMFSSWLLGFIYWLGTILGVV